MKYRMAAAVVVLTLTAGVAASAQGTAPQDRITTAFVRARQAGIPVVLLENKIAEGKAKGVSPERIAAAIERRLVALERANQALRGEADAAASLGVGADAIEAGVSEPILRAVAGNAPPDRRNVAIAALTELVHQGHDPDAALGRVRDALKKGPDALSNLPAEAAAGRGGGPPEGQSQGRGRGQGQGQSQGQGGASGRGASTEPGPPAGVPAPGRQPQSARPDNGRGRGNDNRPSDPGRPDNPGRGR
jgi:hypothetical protein